MAKNREERKDELTEVFKDFLWLLYNKQESSNDCVAEEDVMSFRQKLDDAAAKLKPRTQFDVRIYVSYINSKGEKKKLDPRMIENAADYGFGIPDDAKSISVRARLVAKRNRNEAQVGLVAKKARQSEYKAQAGDEALFSNNIVICRSQARVKSAQEEHKDLADTKFFTIESLENNSAVLAVVPKAEYYL